MISANMELVTELVNNQLTLCIPVALVLIGAILVFTFGFKSAEQPPFDKLSSNIADDRKPAGKKRKTKEKRPTVNGHIANTGESKTEKSPSKRSSKEVSEKPENLVAKLQTDKKKNEGMKNKKADKTEETKVKKNVRGKSTNEKPVDFDDGSWETVPTKGDKKKKQESPVKKEKKFKKVENSTATEKLELDLDPLPSEVDDVKILDLNVSNTTEKEETSLEVEIVIEPKQEINEEEVKIIEDEEPNLDISPAACVTTETAKEIQPVEKQEDKQPEGGIAFDELGDIWTEAKVVKKSKKKSRREN